MVNNLSRYIVNRLTLFQLLTQKSLAFWLFISQEKCHQEKKDKARENAICNICPLCKLLYKVTKEGNQASYLLVFQFSEEQMSSWE